MNTLAKIKAEIKQALGVELEISYPPNPKLGDLSLALFALGKNPAELAPTIQKKLSQNKELQAFISDIKIVGPYVNLFLNYNNLGAGVLSEIKKEANKYGQNDSGQDAGVMVEFSNGNTHKEIHIGHLRNICFGDAVTKLLSANGYKALPASYINDFGIHTAKTLWHFLNNAKYYLSLPGSRGYILGTCYKDAVGIMEGNESTKEEVTQIMKTIESRSGNIYKLWQETRQWSIDYFQEVYQDLGINFTETFYESDVIAAGLKVVAELVDKKILTKSNGAIIADLEKYNLGILPIIRSDGTALYPVADLVLGVKKFTDYKIIESIYVVDTRQSLYFKQLFKILELMGYHQKMTHLAYDFVTLPSGMMSSRSGNVITYRELMDEAIAYAKNETKAKRTDWDDEKIEKVATQIALSTIKFEMLKVSSQKTITFDIKEALKFDGYTATYLQYTHARIMSIAKKGEAQKVKTDYSLLTESSEKTLIIKMAKYPEVVIRGAKNYDPSEITKYIFELCQSFNDYYHNVQIIKSEPNTKTARLELTAAVGQIIKNGLELLGINAINEI